MEKNPSLCDRPAGNDFWPLLIGSKGRIDSKMNRFSQNQIGSSHCQPFHPSSNRSCPTLSGQMQYFVWKRCWLDICDRRQRNRHRMTTSHMTKAPKCCTTRSNAQKDPRLPSHDVAWAPAMASVTSHPRPLLMLCRRSPSRCAASPGRSRTAGWVGVWFFVMRLPLAAPPTPAVEAEAAGQKLCEQNTISPELWTGRKRVNASNRDPPMELDETPNASPSLFELLGQAGNGGGAGEHPRKLLVGPDPTPRFDMPREWHFAWLVHRHWQTRCFQATVSHGTAPGLRPDL